MKEEKIKTKLIDVLFKVLNTDRTKNGEITKFTLLKIEINRHKEKINIVITDLNSMDIFLGYKWLAKHNSEVNWDTEII